MSPFIVFVLMKISCQPPFSLASPTSTTHRFIHKDMSITTPKTKKSLKKIDEFTKLKFGITCYQNQETMPREGLVQVTKNK